jgi:hypothetical protein
VLDGKLTNDKRMHRVPQEIDLSTIEIHGKYWFQIQSAFLIPTTTFHILGFGICMERPLRFPNFEYIVFISPSMPLTGLSLGMYIFHFEAIFLSTHISGSKRPIFTYLGSLERPWPVDGSERNRSPEKDLWPAQIAKNIVEKGLVIRFLIVTCVYLYLYLYLYGKIFCWKKVMVNSVSLSDVIKKGYSSPSVSCITDQNTL